MVATTLFSGPISVQRNSSSFTFSSTKQLPLTLIRASTSSTPTVEDKEEDSSTQSKSIPFGGCQAYGKSEIERGSNGEGRIQGFGWWPIKAYHPCPDFVATGG